MDKDEQSGAWSEWSDTKSTRIHQVTKQKKTKTRTPLVSPVTWQSGLVNPATRAMSDERTQLLGFPRLEMRSS